MDTGVPKPPSPPLSPRVPTPDSPQHTSRHPAATPQHGSGMATTTTWSRFCVLCANLTIPQQVAAWVVLVAGIVLPSMSPAAVAESSVLTTAFRFALFVMFSLVGYQAFTIVQHAHQQLSALEERHEMLTGKNLNLSARLPGQHAPTRGTNLHLLVRTIFTIPLWAPAPCC